MRARTLGLGSAGQFDVCPTSWGRPRRPVKTSFRLLISLDHLVASQISPTSRDECRYTSDVNPWAHTQVRTRLAERRCTPTLAYIKHRILERHIRCPFSPIHAPNSRRNSVDPVPCPSANCKSKSALALSKAQPKEKRALVALSSRSAKVNMPAQTSALAPSTSRAKRIP